MDNPSPLSKKQQRQKKRQALKEQKEMELNSKEVEPPLTSSQEEQVSCELKDSEAMLTQTTSEGRVLQEIHEDSLQQFLDVQEEAEAQVNHDQSPSRDTDFLKSQLEETSTKLQKAQSDLVQKTSIINDNHVKLEQMMEQKEALQNEVEAKKLELCAERQRMVEALKKQEHKAKQTLERAQAVHQAQMSEQRAETNRIAAALTETQDLLETERHVKPKTTTEGELETFKNLSQATIDEQFDVNSKLKAALHKTEQDLKTVHLQWQQERSSITARQQKECEYLQSQMQLIASLRAQEQEAVKQEAVKQTLESVHAFHQALMDEQRAEINGIAAALKETKDLLETEIRDQEDKNKETLKRAKAFHQAQLNKQRAETKTKIDDQSYTNCKLKAALAKAEEELKNGHLQWQETSHFRTNEKVAKQTLERLQAVHQVQLEEQKAETNRTKAALKKTEDLLKTESLCLQEQLYLTAQLEKTCRDFDHNRLKNIATLQTLEEKATQILERDRASQAQLEEQRAEINRIKAARKETEDLLETERFLWQQEKSALLEAQTDLQSQITSKQKKKKKRFFKFF